MCDACNISDVDALLKIAAEAPKSEPDAGRRSILATVLGGFAASLLPASFGGRAKASEPGKFRVGFIAEPAHGLHFIARDKGFFREAGLDVEFLQFKSGAEGLVALKAGQVDIGTFGSAAPLLFISQGNPFTIFGGMMIGGQAIIAKPERVAELKKIENYAGKKFGLVRLSTGDVVFSGALQKAGIDPKKGIERVELPSPGVVVEAVKKGEVDAGLVWSPHFTLAEKQGLAVASLVEDFYPNYTCCRLTVATADFERRKGEYQKYLEALIKAYKVYATDQNETVQIFSDALKLDEEVVRRDTYGRKAFVSHPDPLRKGTLEFWQAMVEADYVQAKDYPVARHIDVDVYKAALDTVIARNPGDRVFAELATFYAANNA
jgi:NitT/TauT family transport system substrate-binding protein